MSYTTADPKHCGFGLSPSGLIFLPKEPLPVPDRWCRRGFEQLCRQQAALMMGEPTDMWVMCGPRFRVVRKPMSSTCGPLWGDDVVEEVEREKICSAEGACTTSRRSREAWVAILEDRPYFRNLPWYQPEDEVIVVENPSKSIRQKER